MGYIFWLFTVFIFILMGQQIAPAMQLIIIQPRTDVVVNCLFQFSAT